MSVDGQPEADEADDAEEFETVEDAVNDLRAFSRPGQAERRVADRLENALEAERQETQVVDTSRSKAYHLSRLLLGTVRDYNTDTSNPAPIEEILDLAEDHGVSRAEAREHLNNCQKRGELYEPVDGMLIATDVAGELEGNESPESQDAGTDRTGGASE